MQSNIFDRVSFLAFLITTSLLPVFFLPFSKIPIETSKGLLVVLGLAVSLSAWAIARFFDGKVSIPKSYVLLSGAAVVLAFLLSALFSPVPLWSLWGIMFDVGSFWFIFAAFMLLFTASVVVSSTRRARILLFGFIGSFALVLVFQFIHLLWPAQTAFGVLPNKFDNLLGSWNILGIMAGLLVILALFTIEFLDYSKEKKVALGVLLGLSYLFVLMANYSLVFWMLGILALVIFVFKFLLYTRARTSEGSKAVFPFSPLAILVVSLLFLMSGNAIRGYLPEKFGISESVEIRAPLGATFNIAKETLKDRPIFGAGPNRFGEMWSLHRPMSVNVGSLWDVSFDFGWSLMLTFIVTLGIVGTIAWLVFLFFLFNQGLKSVFISIREKSNYEPALFFLGSSFLFLSACFHPFGSTLFFVAFILAGAFIGVQTALHPDRSIKLSFLDDPRKSFFAIAFLIVLMILSVLAVIRFTYRFSSVSYFKQALELDADLALAEQKINKAIALNPNDLYLRTASQVYVRKLQSLIVKSPKPSEAEGLVMQKVLNQVEDASLKATTFNHTNYLNFFALGIVYEFGGSLGAPGSYDKALASYASAAQLNPVSPGVKLAMARSALASKNKAEAKAYAEESLALKPDYLEALVFLSQMYRNEGDIALARKYAEEALYLLPGNKDIIAYLEALKVPTPAVQAEPEKPKTKKTN